MTYRLPSLHAVCYPLTAVTALSGAMILGLLLLQVAGLILIPFGMPGLWLQIAAALGLMACGAMRWEWIAGFVVLAAIAEGIEFSRWGSQRFGGSSTAAWGALIGGSVGAIVGDIPLPIIGGVITSFVGTFVGALVGEMVAQRRVAPDLRVGVGAVFGRVIGVAIKLWVGVLVLVASIAVVML